MKVVLKHLRQAYIQNICFKRKDHFLRNASIMKIAQKQLGENNSSEQNSILVCFLCMYVLPGCYYYQLNARKWSVRETCCILDPETNTRFKYVPKCCYAWLYTIHLMPNQMSARPYCHARNSTSNKTLFPSFAFLQHRCLMRESCLCCRVNQILLFTVCFSTGAS